MFCVVLKMLRRKNDGKKRAAVSWCSQRDQVCVVGLSAKGIDGGQQKMEILP